MAFFNKKPEVAVGLWEQALKLSEGHFDALTNQTMFLWSTGQISDNQLMERLTDVFDRKGKGQALMAYLYLAQGERGQEGTWQRDGIVGNAGRMIAIVCILNAVRLDELLTAIYAAIEHQIGIVSVSDVDVVRSEHF